MILYPRDSSYTFCKCIVHSNSHLMFEYFSQYLNLLTYSISANVCVRGLKHLKVMEEMHYLGCVSVLASQVLKTHVGSSVATLVSSNSWACLSHGTLASTGTLSKRPRPRGQHTQTHVSKQSNTKVPNGNGTFQDSITMEACVSAHLSALKSRPDLQSLKHQSCSKMHKAPFIQFLYGCKSGQKVTKTNMLNIFCRFNLQSNHKQYKKLYLLFLTEK